jgi:hypothetical protein
MTTLHAEQTKTNSNCDTPWENANVLRLSWRQWLLVFVAFACFVIAAPWLWSAAETWEHDAQYRIPYALSNDYWLYQRHLAAALMDGEAIPVMGDSVVWGEFVNRDGTLSHWLDELDSSDRRYVNAGLNGMFPLALEGLVRHYGDALVDRRVLLHCNLLWMSSPEQDLSVSKERTFNHSELIPQFRPSVPCYRADTAERMRNVVHRQLTVFGWMRHIQACYYDHKSIPAWTLDEGSGNTGANALKMPWAPIDWEVPGEPELDSQRGPHSDRHRAWTDSGIRVQRFDWVEPDASLQWGAFQRLTRLLQARGNQVTVVVGPLNAHLMDEATRAGYQQWCDVVAEWLSTNGIDHIRLPTLDTELYADASHPLTEGYRRMAEETLLRLRRETRHWKK